ncbi:unnamed protein product [Schistosoma mattheei]|uniref:Uncharacterized protein n=1 Tax=Schistosoma mattheei TaxID=31246 RepID=A0A3P8GLI7_9TREM|nr:unnamed protein product [Schistosoma mattheei]
MPSGLQVKLDTLPRSDLSHSQIHVILYLCTETHPLSEPKAIKSVFGDHIHATILVFINCRVSTRE